MAGWLDKAEKILISASLALAWADLDKNLVKFEKKKNSQKIGSKQNFSQKKKFGPKIIISPRKFFVSKIFHSIKKM